MICRFANFTGIGKWLSLRFRLLPRGSALAFWLRHLCDFALLRALYRNGRYHGPNLVFGLTLSLLQEIPERIDEDVIAGRPLVFLGPADLANPPYRCPVFGGETNGSPVSLIRDVFFSRAHSQIVIDCTLALSHYYVIVQ